VVAASSLSACSAISASACTLSGSQYATQLDCEAAGVCSNDYIFYNSSGARVNGVCIVPANPWHLDECEGLQRGVRPVKDGCADYAITSAACTGKNGTWVTPATSAAACAAFGKICLKPVTGKEVGSYFLDEVYTMQNEADCKLQDGATYADKYTWTAGRWLAPNAVSAQWVAAQLVPRWSMSNDTLILPRLQADLDAAIQAKIRFQRKTYSFCRYAIYSSAVTQLDCACGSNARADVSTCYSSSTSGSSIAKTASITDVCGGAPADIVASPVESKFTPRSLTPFGACVPVSLQIVPALRYQSVTSDNTATYFIDFSEKTTWSFRNSKSALVGQVIGDGVGIEFNVSIARLNSDVTLCSQRRSDIIEIQSTAYDTLDFALASSTSTELRPLGLNVTEDALSGQLCATFKPEVGALYMPVQRTADWASAEHEVFTVGEFATLIVVVIMYGLIILLAAYRLHPLVLMRVWHFGVGVVIPLVLLYFVRLFYFALLLGGALNVNEANVGIFVLVELPMLFYLSTTLYFVVNWAFVTRSIRQLRQKSSRPVMLRAFGYVLIVLALIFIAFIFAFGFGVRKPYTLCADQLTVTDNSSAKTIATTYRLVMGILALLLGICFIAFGSILFLRVRHEEHSKVRQTITVQASICAISLIAEALFFIVIALLTSYRNNIFSMCWMLVCECLPGLAVLYTLDVHALVKAAETTRTLSRGSTRKGDLPSLNSRNENNNNRTSTVSAAAAKTSSASS